MFSCFYKLIWIQAQHDLLKIQERRRPGLLRLLLQRKRRRKSPRGVSSLSPSASRFPPSPHSPPSPPAVPPRPGSILTSSLEERKRPGILHLLSRGKGGGEAQGALLLRLVVVAAPLFPLFPVLLSLLLPLLPTPTPSPQMCVLLLPPTGWLLCLAGIACPGAGGNNPRRRRTRRQARGRTGSTERALRLTVLPPRRQERGERCCDLPAAAAPPGEPVKR